MLESFSNNAKLGRNMEGNEMFKQLKIGYIAWNLILSNLELMFEEACKYNKNWLKYEKKTW
jgi:hypothetical protein